MLRPVEPPEARASPRADTRRPSRRSRRPGRSAPTRSRPASGHESTGPADGVHQPGRGPAILRADHVDRARRRCWHRRCPCTSPAPIKAAISIGTDVDQPVRNTNGAARIRPRLCTMIRPPADRRRAPSRPATPPNRAPGRLASGQNVEVSDEIAQIPGRNARR